ncbi:tandem-type lipoprotein [Staphylococcus caprae]|uniref:tandem-type lipoprotein n=2 Tax=Staphylococcus caprae TaxID=29380 RepID=UPI00254D943A|nr:tandem-type lipoprotein [Staphylococcus caprae]MDK6298176.1 tandem-type lipoprotein [Staphylococcus caprae]
MHYLKKVTIYISLLVLIILVSGCGDSKETEIKKSFNKTLSMYPTKNLEDFYDKEGYRDEEFDKDDKGTWIIRSEMTKQPKGKIMTSRGMVLHINRNTRTTHGYYVVRKISEDNVNNDKEKKYPVKMESNKITPTKKIKDEKLKKEIENFKFFVQYGNFKDLKDYKNGEVSYNPNEPNYSAQYQLSNDDYNVKQLRKRYDISTNQAPKLILKGTGDIKGSSVGYKHLEFTFVQNEEENIYFTNSLNFNPSKDNE